MAIMSELENRLLGDGAVLVIPRYPNIDPLIKELEQVEKLVEIGQISLLTKENFPNISQAEPGRIPLAITRALYNRIGNFNSARGAVRQDSDAADRLSAEMAKSYKSASSVVKESFPEYRQGDEKTIDYFYLNPQDKAALDVVVTYGFIDSLNDSNLPFLKALSSRERWRLTAQTIISGLDSLDIIRDRTKQETGIGTQEGKFPITHEKALKEIEDLERLMEQCSSEIRND